VELHLFPLGQRRIWMGFAGLLMLAWTGLACIFCTLGCYLWRTETSADAQYFFPPFVGLMGLFCLLGTSMLGYLFCLAGTSAVVRATEGWLSVYVLGRWHRHLFVWTREQLQAIQAEEGLFIFSTRGDEQLFWERDPSELAWLAEVLRRVLSIPEDAFGAPDELPVSFRFDFSRKTSVGYLVIRSGEMVLRPHWCREGCVFRARRLTCRPGCLRRLWDHSIGKAVILGPEDFRWRRGRDGRTRLDIDPAPPPDWSLELWCDDPDMLKRELERFWQGPAPEPAITH